MPVELGLEFGAIVGLHDLDAKRQPASHLVDEPDGRSLIAGVIDLEHTDPGAVVDGRELVEALLRSRDALEELHVHLQAVTRLGLLVALPALNVRLVLLVRREPPESVLVQKALHRRGRDANAVKRFR